MLNRMIGVSIALVMMLVPVSALAQKEPAGRWWRSPQVSKQLHLTGNEIQRLENAYNQSRRSIIKLKGRVESEQFELQTMVENRNADSATIKSQHRKLERARSDLAASKFDFVVEARKIIGYDRFQKLLKMQSGSKAKLKKGRK
jgi:Spy/CpxP family protein refolding chaperone